MSAAVRQNCPVVGAPQIGVHQVQRRSVNGLAYCRPAVSRRTSSFTTASASVASSPAFEALDAPVVFYAEFPRLLEALAAGAAASTPLTTTQLLQRLEIELPPVFSSVGPNGSCVPVATEPVLLPLLEHSAWCCEQSLLAGRACQAVAIGKAVLCLVACLRFGSPASAAAYAAVATHCKQTLKAAYDANADILQEDIIELYSACARASRYLWLTPYFGHRFACVVDDCISEGWATGELAVQFTEAWSTLAGHGRLTQQLDKWVRLVRAALRHQLSMDQLSRLFTCTQRLPVEMSIALELHARSEPADCWYRQLTRRMQQEQVNRSALHSAAATVPAEFGRRGCSALQCA